MVKEMEKEREESESLLKSQVKDVKERHSEQQKKIIELETIVEKQKEVKERERGSEKGGTRKREGGIERGRTYMYIHVHCTFYLLGM